MRLDDVADAVSTTFARLMWQADQQDWASSRREALGSGDAGEHSRSGPATTTAQIKTGDSDSNAPYDYSFTFDISGPGGAVHDGAMLWPMALAQFETVFPIPGMPNNPQVGDEFEIFGSPVRVTGIGPTSLTLESLPGHLEGAGNTITFSVSPDGTQFSVDATGPNQMPMIGMWIPQTAWPHLAWRLQQLQNDVALAPGPEAPPGPTDHWM